MEPDNFLTSANRALIFKIVKEELTKLHEERGDIDMMLEQEEATMTTVYFLRMVDRVTSKVSEVIEEAYLENRVDD